MTCWNPFGVSRRLSRGSLSGTTSVHGFCGIEVISEASRHLTRELKSPHRDVRWKDIAGIGNILRHEYQRVDGRIIWKAVRDDLPPLKEALLEIKSSLEKEG